jgi:hypothetical protein
MDDELEMVRFEVLTAILIMLHKSLVLALCIFRGLASCGCWCRCPQALLFTSYISPLYPCFVSSSPEDGDSMFLRNVSIDLQIHTAPKPKTSAETRNELKEAG